MKERAFPIPIKNYPHMLLFRTQLPDRLAQVDTYFGPGTVETVKCHLNAVDSKDGFDAVFVNAILTGIQQRNLERDWGKPVLDRVALIIEIFNAHAQTKEGKLQAELAALMYKRSRLVRVRGPGGRYSFGSTGETEVVSARGRGSGGRGFISGAGETELQLQRRRIIERRNQLLSEIKEVRRTRALQRASRKRHGSTNGQDMATVAVVGYTNAGKSTLVSSLSDSYLYCDDRLFATVDPKLRSVVLPSGRKVLLSDTVGFISELPVQLVEAFHATLEEVVEADLLVGEVLYTQSFNLVAMSRRQSNSTRRFASSPSNPPFSGFSHSKSRISPLLPVVLVFLGAIFFIGYYRGSGVSGGFKGGFSRIEGDFTCTFEVQRALPILKKAHGDSMHKVLHVGPDTCSVVSKLLKEEETEAWGVEPYDIEDADGNCKRLVRKGYVRVADIKFPLPYRAKSFSLVIVSDAVDYLSPKYLNMTLSELARVSSDGIIIFAGFPGHSKAKITEPSKYGRPAKKRSTNWWVRFFVQSSLEENVMAYQKFVKTAVQDAYKPGCHIFHLNSYH